MIYVQFPIDDTSLISKSAEIFTRDSNSWPGSVSWRIRHAGKVAGKVAGKESQGIRWELSWAIEELGNCTGHQAGGGEENGTLRTSS